MTDSHETTAMVQPDKNSRDWIVACHLFGLGVLLTAPLVMLIGPAVIWYLKRDESAFINEQGKEVINFHITVTLAMLFSWFTAFIFIGVILGIVVMIFTTYQSIKAAMAASRGEAYRYPLTLRLIA